MNENLDTPICFSDYSYNLQDIAERFCNDCKLKQECQVKSFSINNKEDGIWGGASKFLIEYRNKEYDCLSMIDSLLALLLEKKIITEDQLQKILKEGKLL